MIAASLLLLQLDRLMAPLRAERPPVATTAAREAERTVADGFERFDADGDGAIAMGEFGRWMAALRPDAEGGAAEPAWAARAFRTADSDGNGTLGRGELARFLAETVSWRLPMREGGAGSGPRPSHSWTK